MTTLPVLPLKAFTEIGPACPGAQVSAVSLPRPGAMFLHEAAIVEYKGVLYASWYTNDEKELSGHTPIRGRRSRDGGKTWSEEEILAEAPGSGILYCPPVYAKADGRLWLLMNEMVSADHMHALDLYVLNEETGHFDFVWSRPIPFKLNTNAVTLPNGNLLLPGRIAELDGFPHTPAVLICDSGHPNREWRLVKVMENGDLPDGTRFVHPEVSLLITGNTLTMICRHDEADTQVLFRSDDLGEHWSGPFASDLPLIATKAVMDRLRDGRPVLVGNAPATREDRSARSRLVLFTGEPGGSTFTHAYALADGVEASLGCGFAWHYPAITEADGVLYIICTLSTDSWSRRGAALFTVKL